ncbi:unnamed protein product (macronuclear) [Paramecium tetraurelia]|uniref:Uncharacterized protein n=1 Tax=Paramecium tetraurelia TaxID=5888 RepID=A0C9R3_PARTE|nr:uncharacterized protein GSPATT00006837001 [Paramecium tetraurelia]CAK67530.1 unnamed protein product [Paramecium tetraurelia]|eukprot:XP_001434927.1 hypothetical protein (macronuclear) [Paramecium tetraurelia strain d4-2]
MSYSDKHKRNTSPVLRTTSEDRIKQNSCKESIQLDQQIDKIQQYLSKKYDDRMKFVEETLQEHEEKFESFIKLIKLLQHFATSQEQENKNIRNHINISMEQLYNEELNYLKDQNLNIEQQILEIQRSLGEEQPQIQEFETIVNKKIDVIMDEVRQSALKTDYQKIESRLQRLEHNIKQEAYLKGSDSDRVLNNSLVYQNQLNDLKIVLDSVIQDQELTKNHLKQIEHDLYSIKQKEKQSYLRTSITKESQNTETDVMASRPIRDPKENIKNKDNNKRNKSKSSQSRSESRNARLETIKKKKQESVKDLIKRHKQQSNKQY